MQSQQEIKIWLEENKITEVECLVPDMTGNARGKFIPAKKFLKEDSRLPEGILAQTVTVHPDRARTRPSPRSSSTVQGSGEGSVPS